MSEASAIVTAKIEIGVRLGDDRLDAAKTVPLRGIVSVNWRPGLAAGVARTGLTNRR